MTDKDLNSKNASERYDLLLRKGFRASKIRMQPKMKALIVIFVVVCVILVLIGFGEVPHNPQTNVSQSATSTTQVNEPNFDWVVFSGNDSVAEANFNPVKLDTGFIKVGKDPVSIVDDPTGLQLYVVDELANEISVVNLYSYATYRTLRVGNRPVFITICPKTAMAYVINQGDNTVTPIHLLGLKIMPTFYAGPDPTSIALNSTGTMAFISDAGNNTVLPIDLTKTNPIALTPIPVGADPEQVLTDSSGSSFVYVLNRASGSISVINMSLLSVTANYTLGGELGAMTMSEGLPDAYVTDLTNNEIIPFSLLNGAIGTPIKVNFEPTAITINLRGTYAFVIGEKSGQAAYVDLQNGSTVSNSAIGNGPVALSYMPA